MMWQRLLNRLLVALLLTLLLLVGATTALLATQGGNLWLLERAQPYLPGKLQVQGWQGSLATGLKINELTWQQGELTVSLSRLDLLLDVSAIFSGRLHLYHLNADTLAITLPAAAKSGDHQPLALPNSLALPFGVRIDSLALQHLRLTGTTQLAIDTIQANDLSAWHRLRIGSLALTLDGTHLDANLNGRLSAPYPLAGRLHWDGKAGGLGVKGQLALAGNLEHLLLNGQGDLQRDAQTLHLELAAKASLDQLALDRLTLSNAKQQLTLSGQLDFFKDGDKSVRWQLDAKGKHLDPGLLLPAWPGDLNLALRSQGHWTSPDDWTASASPLHLDGQLKERPLRLDGKTQQQGKQLALDLTGQWGKDRLSAKGSAGKTLVLTGQIAIADLSQWLADSQGSLDLDWQLAGTPAMPTLRGRLNGTALGWQGWQLQRLRTHFTRLSLGKSAMRLDLDGEALTHNGSPLADHFTLTASGTRAHHQLDLTATRAPGQTQITVTGSLDANRWQGQLQQWRLTSGDIGWHLQQPAPLTLSATTQQLKSACLVPDQGQGKLCLNGSHHNNNNGNQLAAHLDASQLPLALANPWLDEALRLGGHLNADANISQNGQQLTGQWQASVAEGALTFTGTRAQQTFRLTTASLTGKLHQGRINNRLDLAVADVGEVRAEIEHGLSAQAPLGGELHLSIPRLDDFAPLLPHVSQLHGSLSGDLRLDGNLQQPGASGRLTLADGALTLPELGVNISAIRLDLDGTPEGLRLQGQAGFDQQLLHLDGHWQPSRSLYALDLAIQGQNLLVANRRDAKVLISPDLSLKGAADGLHLQGTLTVPEASLAPRQLPENAISVSKDQVLVGVQAPGASPLPLFVDLGIHLGKQVRFQGFGLNASLGGDLKVTQKPAQPLQLYGELVIREGRYKAYGQNLAIDNGRLLFQGPADDPGLDIRALRKIPSENRTVGVQLAGTLQHPKAQIFSDPALEESQAMSYLLTGHGLNQGSQGDRAKIARALALYGLQQGEGVTNKISDTLGLDEITVGSEWGDADDAALMLGKQLSDRLYLTYAVGLFDAVSTVMLRYTLTRSLHLEAQSSSRSQAIDLIWEKELK